MRWAHPFVLHGVWLALLVFLWVRWRSRRLRRPVELFSEENWRNLATVDSRSAVFWRQLLVMVAVQFLCLAGARPQLGTSLQNTKSLGVELLVAIDVSESMLAEDNKPSRLQFAKSEIGRLLDRLTGDRVGLIAFAGSAFLVSPITSDKAALKMFLDGLTPQSVTTQGTNVASALKAASEAFERGGVDDPESGARATRVILIASDGEDHEEGAIKAARDLAQEGVRVFTWGFGTEKGAPVPQRDEFGNLRGYKKDKSGQVIVSTVKDGFMRSLAEAGQGQYVHAVFGGSAPEVVEKALDKMQKAEFASSQQMIYDERFQVPLSVAVFISFLTVLIRGVTGARALEPLRKKLRETGA